MKYSIEVFRSPSTVHGVCTVVSICIDDIRTCYRYRIYGRGIINHQIFEDYIKVRLILKQATTMRLLSLLKCESNDHDLIKLRLVNMDYDFTEFLDYYAETINSYKNL